MLIKTVYDIVLWIIFSSVDLTMSISLHTVIIIFTIYSSSASEDGYLRYVKDGCFIRGEALNCVKYKALKITKHTLFGDVLSNTTIKANQMISLVPLDEDIIKNFNQTEKESLVSEPRSILSEWTELAKYFMKLVQEFFRMKGLRVNLPEGARTVEDEDENARGKKKKLAIVIPLLTLLAALKTKLLLIPVLLSVLLIKKLLLIAALLLPSLLSTLKACKHHHPMSQFSYFGSSDTNDYNADYGSTYAYSSGGGYGKDWASNRAYNLKHRPTPAPAYVTAPGGLA